MKSRFIAVLLGMMMLIASPVLAIDFDFSGNFAYHNDVLAVTFNGGSGDPVTLFTSSWDDGGFDPMLGLFDGSGALLIWQDDGLYVGSTMSNGTSYTHGAWDSFYTYVLPSTDTYTVAILTYENRPAGSSLSNGFVYGGETPIPIASWSQPENGYRNSDYAFHILNAREATQTNVPEPSTLLLLGSGLLGLVGLNRRRQA